MLCDLMCNAYQIGPDASQQRLLLADRVMALLPPGGPRLIRKTELAPVVTADGEARLMRWGFHRSFNPAVNNTRADKLLGPMWLDAFRQRRCLIPMSVFYEWSAGGGGRKQAHEFRDPAGHHLWIAGIWERHPDLGPCFSMITTNASPVMEPIHERMPAILPPEELERYLTDRPPPPGPYVGPLAVAACASPLVRKPPSPGEWQEEFGF